MDLLNVNLLLRILVAHFLSDFIFHPTKLAAKKDNDGSNHGIYMYI